MISYPFMRPAQPRDPIRYPPVMQHDTYVEPDIPQYPVAAAAMKEGPTDARSHVEQLQHTVVTYIFSLL